MSCVRHQCDDGLLECKDCKIERLYNQLKEACAKLRTVCSHYKTHFENWPDGGEIEVCEDCGMSRYHWEQGETKWVWIEDIPGARKQLQESLDNLGGKHGKDRRSSKS